MRERDDDREDPDRRIVEAEIDREDANLRDADDRRDEADDRADREIDVAHHDDEHHAGRHDRDRRRLDAQIPEVARRQEQALAGLDLRVDVEPDPDQQQRADHAEHARVDLGRSKQTANGRFVGGGARRAGRCGGHGLSLVFVFSRRRRAASGRRIFARGRAALKSGAAQLLSGCRNGRSAQLAERGRAGLHAGADFRLGDPALVDDHVEVVLGDRRAGSAGCR